VRAFTQPSVAAFGAAEIGLAITVVTVILAGIGVYVTLRGIRDQLWLQTFAEYTRRYAEIVRELPSESRRPDGSFDLDTLATEDRGRVLNAARGYLNLTAEEYFLHKRGRIDHETWEIWKSGIVATMTLPWVRLAWTELEQEYMYFPEYCSFVSECMAAEQRN
jgi:hypothetical protein